MNEPYDPERGAPAPDGPDQRAPGPEGRPQGPHPQAPHARDAYHQDAYTQDTYTHDAYAGDPYRRRDVTAQDPVHEVLYDQAEHPPPPPPPGPETLYQQPPAQRHAPDPRRWASPPAPEPDGPSRRLPYGDEPARVQYTGVDELITRAPDDDERHGAVPRQEPEDAFAHLFRDQQVPAQPPHPHAASAQPQPAYGAPPHGAPAQAATPPHAHRPPQSRAQQSQQPQQPQRQQPAAHQHAARRQEPTHPPGNQPEHSPGGSHPPGGPRQQVPYAGEAPLPPPPPGTQPTQASAPPQEAPAAPDKPSGRGGGLLKSSAIMAAGTLVSRLTGFLRTLVITAALGAVTLGDSYTVAYTLPTMVYMLSIGGGLNSVFVPQLVRAMKDDEDGGEAYANRLLTLVMVVLAGLVAVTVLAAPLLVRMLSPTIADNPDANSVAVTFARYCLPTIFFMGVHVVMGQILNARGRFGAMMWTPVLNNLVIIFAFGSFIWVYGTFSNSDMAVTTISDEGVRLLGMGTLLGLVVQALAMLPFLKAAGFRFRPRFDWKGQGLGKAIRLAKWTFFFVLANQAGLVVVTQLATAAGYAAAAQDNEGAGILGYQNALLIWQMPQAIITVSVMAALLPRLSRSARDGDVSAVRDDLSHGLRTSAVAIVPIAFAFLALGVPMCLMLYASAGTDAATSMGLILMAFGLGLIPFSVQYVVLRAFYAYEDTRTPFYNTVIVAIGNAAGAVLCYLLLPSRYAVAGMAATYGLAYVLGVVVAWRRLRRTLDGDLDGSRIARAYARLCIASIPAALLAGGTAYGVIQYLGNGFTGGLAALVAGSLVMGVVFLVAAKRMRIQELTAMIGMVRAKLGR
ncbi:murein biosynthesis integral membrane protein MurJ [Streptomyces sp. TRM70308]|uniref:murein biosynthesis integral membrane protein MurJ n=1 Tax=Streptomyces sp. TRM70308 TaxID=3131932 RepID=UPI003D026E0B